MSHLSKFPENRHESFASDPSCFHQPTRLHSLILSLGSHYYLLSCFFSMKCNDFSSLQVPVLEPVLYQTPKQERAHHTSDKRCTLWTTVSNRRAHEKIYRTIVKANNDGKACC